MYFGDFLIQKKLITNDQLIEALSFQLESLPSLIRLLHEGKLISSDKLLEIVKKQIQMDTDIVDILKSEKLITDEKLNELLMLQISKKPPLGEVLVQLKFVNQEAINKALDDYFNEKDLVVQNETKNTKDSKPLEENTLSDAALESLRELGMDISELIGSESSSKENYPPKSFIDQFFDVFSEKYKNKLNKLISIIESASKDGSDISNYTNSLYRDIHMLKGTVTLVELNQLNELVGPWDQSIENIISRPNDEICQWVTTYSGNLIKSIDLIWDYRNKIKDLSTDEFLSSDSKWSSSVKNFIPKN